jgi:hypothetical protein
VSASSRRRTLGIAWAGVLLGLVGVAATLATPGSVSGADAPTWGTMSFVVVVAAFSGVGGLISLRRPGDVIGRLLAVIGLLFAVVVAGSAVSRWALHTGSLPEGVAAWMLVAGSAWVPALGLVGTQLPLRLPDGALPSPRWRRFSQASALLIAVSTVGMAVQPGWIDGPDVPNPLASESLKWLASAFFLVLASFVVALVALVTRYRRSRARERAQLRWIAFGGVIFLGVYFMSLPLPGLLGLAGDSAGAVAITSVSQTAFAALPIAIGYAVLKHRLYDIELVVNRALVYGTLSATLAAAYVCAVLLIGLALGRSGLSVAASTLAVAALFGPARARIQSAVDRRFYRHRYDAARELEAFGVRLRNQLDLDELDTDLRDVVRQTVQPAHVSLWLRSRP